MLRGLLSPEHPRDSLRHIAGQSAWAGLAQLGGVFLRLATAVLIARLVGPAALGLYVLALTLANGATVVATFGLDRTVLHFIAHHRGTEDAGAAVGVFVFASAVAATLAVAVGALVFVGAPHLAMWLHHPELVAAARVVALATPFLTLGQVARAGLTGFQDVRLAVALEQIAVPVATAAVVVVVHLRNPHDALAAVVAAALAQGGIGVVSWVALRGRLAHEAAPVILRPSQWLRFSIPLWVERGMLFVVAAAGYGFLARSADTATVGAYGAALRVAGLVGLPLLAVSTIFGPTVSNLASRGDWARLQVLYARLTWALAAIGGTVGLAVAASGRWVLAGFGPRFSAAAGALAILAASQVVNSATGPSGLVLIMTGRTVWRLANAGIGAGLTLALSWWAVPRWGAVGAAAAVGLSSALMNVVQVYQVRRLVGLWAYDRPRHLGDRGHR